MGIWREKPVLIAIAISLILGVVFLFSSFPQIAADVQTEPLTEVEPGPDDEIMPLESEPSVTRPPFTSYILPTVDGGRVPDASHSGGLPTGTGALDIEGVGSFTFNAGEVETVRPDIFQPGHFSVFDILVHLHGQGEIGLAYHYDEKMNTHLIETIDGKTEWWYKVKYAGGWFEDNVFRMDMYPYKNVTEIRIIQYSQQRLTAIYDSFKQEVTVLAQNGGQVVIPKAIVGHRTFTDVMVVAHDLRTDVLKPGVVTALDLILSLAEQEQIERLKLTWYERIGKADPIDSYFIEQIDLGDGVNDDEAEGGCGWVYETGSDNYPWFSGNHIHLPADVRVILSPDYADWFWICL